MSVGYEISKATVDSRSGTLAVRLRDTLRQCGEFNTWLETQPNQDLEALGYTSPEVAQLKSAFADAAELAAVYRGEATVDSPKDFTTFLKILVGPR